MSEKIELEIEEPYAEMLESLGDEEQVLNDLAQAVEEIIHESYQTNDYARN